MKVFAIAAALLASVASAADCNVGTLAPLLEETYVAQCSTDTGFQFVPPTVPSAEVLAKVCESEACQQTLAKLESFGLGDCLLLGTLLLETDLINPINTECGFSSAPTGSTAGSSSAAVGSDVGEESGESSSDVEEPAASASSAEETEAPSASSSSAEATPTPTPDNGAAQTTVAITAAAAAVVVAAAL